MMQLRFSPGQLPAALLCFCILGCGDDDGGPSVAALHTASCDQLSTCNPTGFDVLYADLQACYDELPEQECFLNAVSATCREANLDLGECVTALDCAGYLEYLDEPTPTYPCVDSDAALDAACTVQETDLAQQACGSTGPTTCDDLDDYLLDCYVNCAPSASGCQDDYDALTTAEQVDIDQCVVCLGASSCTQACTSGGTDCHSLLENLLNVVCVW